MRSRLFMVVPILLFFLMVVGYALAQKKPAEVFTLKLEGAKLAPVTFSHALHAEKLKLDCKTCHHKDTDPQNPEKCDKCHLISETKAAPIAKEAYHKNCIDCHKKEVASGKKAPTKCTECHKK